MNAGNAMGDLLMMMNKIRGERGDDGLRKWLDSMITHEFLGGNHSTAQFLVEVKSHMWGQEG